MQNYKKAAASIAFLTLIFTAGLSMNYSVAKDYYLDDKDQAEQENVLEAIENNDYKTWRTLISSKSELTDLITKADFESFVAARYAARNGKYDSAIYLANSVEEKLKEKLNQKILV